MPFRYLYGPVTAAFANQHLFEARQASRCLTFNALGDTDLTIGPDDSWETILSRLPSEWVPDLVVVRPDYTSIPEGVWSAPLPLIGTAGDWNLLWHSYRFTLPRCDAMLADTPGVKVLAQSGLPLVRQVNLYGLGRDYLRGEPQTGPRDIDLLFIGNFNAAVQSERLCWLARLAAFAGRWNVVVTTGVFGTEYRALLSRSRIVFNRSIRGECNQRALEAAACGCLLLQEADNREVARYLKPGLEYAPYTFGNLEDVIEHYLTHEEERAQIARAGQERVRHYSFGVLLDQALEALHAEWPALQERAKKRAIPSTETVLKGRVWQAVGTSLGNDPTLQNDLAALCAEEGAAATWFHALGIIEAQNGQQHGRSAVPLLRRVAGHFERATLLEPDNPLFLLNHIEVLVALEEKELAAQKARHALALLERGDDFSLKELDSPHFLPTFDTFRVEWDRAAWLHVGKPHEELRAKLDLLRWRLHLILGDLTQELTHFRAAVAIRPDLPVSQAALGCALGRAGQAVEALPHLQQAVTANPFDCVAARALFQALGDAQERDKQVQLATSRRLLARAAPRLIRPERWFEESLPAVASLPLPSRHNTATVPAAAADVTLRNGRTTAPPTPHAKLTKVTEKLAIRWEGVFDELHSLALVNRQFCQQLLRRGHELSLFNLNFSPDLAVQRLDVPPELTACFRATLSRDPDVTIRHRWPPDFTPPASGHWVMIQPWEFGSLPAAWIKPIIEQVDEVWAYTKAVRDCYLEAGIPAERVHVVPLGVDPSCFRPGMVLYPLKTAKRFKFLFVGGTIPRKGIDILLQAYAKAFTAQDDVCLVVKGMGAESFYRGQTAESDLDRLRSLPNAPEVEYLEQALSEVELAGLYCACDCLVHPYRGEGFALPVVEAMASGLPVIVTGKGAALDYCDESRAYFIPAQARYFTQKKVGEIETLDRPWLAEPNEEALIALLRYVLTHDEEVQRKAAAALAFVRDKLTWAHATDWMVQRLQELRGRPIRRLTPENERTVAGQLPQPPSASKKLRVTLTMIVKNEEANLPHCLASVTGLFDEIIVVDTGSTDRTKDLALAAGAKVYDFPWIDNFAAARNESLRHATGDWIFWLDADDRIDEVNRPKLRALLANLKDEQLAYTVKCRCLPDASGSTTTVDHVRLFRNRPDVRWEFRVHEQILLAVRRSGAEVRWAELVVDHTGYVDPALRRRKLERDLRLLKLEDAARPGHPFTLFNLGSVAQELGHHAEALDSLQRSLKASHPKDSIVRKLYALIAHCQDALGQPEQALRSCAEGLGLYPEDGELLFRQSALQQSRGDLAGAEASLLRLLTTTPGEHFASVTDGLRGYKGRNNLAALLHKQGRHAEAETQWKLAVAEKPGFLPGQLGLAELYLIQKRWSDAEESARRLEGMGENSCVDATVLRARGHLARREFTQARELLDAIIADNPGALYPRVILSHVLLQEGNSPDDAEQALLAILKLDPNHGEAKSNLAVLMNKRMAEKDAVFRVVGGIDPRV